MDYSKPKINNEISRLWLSIPKPIRKYILYISYKKWYMDDPCCSGDFIAHGVICSLKSFENMFPMPPLKQKYEPYEDRYETQEQDETLQVPPSNWKEYNIEILGNYIGEPIDEYYEDVYSTVLYDIENLYKHYKYHKCKYNDFELELAIKYNKNKFKQVLDEIENKIAYLPGNFGYEISKRRFEKTIELYNIKTFKLKFC